MTEPKKRADVDLPQSERPFGGPGPEERDLPLTNEEITQRIEEFERGKAEMDRTRKRPESRSPRNEP